MVYLAHNTLRRIEKATIITFSSEVAKLNKYGYRVRQSGHRVGKTVTATATATASKLRPAETESLRQSHWWLAETLSKHDENEANIKHDQRQLPGIIVIMIQLRTHPWCTHDVISRDP